MTQHWFWKSSYLSSVQAGYPNGNLKLEPILVTAWDKPNWVSAIPVVIRTVLVLVIPVVIRTCHCPRHSYVSLSSHMYVNSKIYSKIITTCPNLKLNLQYVLQKVHWHGPNIPWGCLGPREGWEYPAQSLIELQENQIAPNLKTNFV